MKLNLKNPLVVLDIEATGVNFVHDRIVEIAIIKLHPNGSEEVKEYLINPEMPIPEETQKIHGISDEDVKDAPTFRKIAKELAGFLGGADIAGFNVLKLDLPILMEEFLRADVEFDISKRKIVDAQKIFTLMEKRNLSAALKFYCNRDLKDAHSAMADTRATLDVLNSQLEKYNGQEVQDNLGNRIGSIDSDIESLSEFTTFRMVDLAGRMTYNQEGVEIFNFGKHRGKPVTQVLEKEPAYYNWIMNGEFPLDTKRKLTQIKLRNFGGKS